MQEGRCDHCSFPVPQGAMYCDNCGAVLAWNIPTEIHRAEAPRAFLLIHLPGGIVRTVPLVGTVVRIGRSNKCDVVVDHPRVSRHHATLELVDGAFLLSDAKSSGGTFVNDLPIHAPRGLRSGDTCRLGRLPGDSVSFVYHEGDGT